jgi:AcrR family transcriptional regulator
MSSSRIKGRILDAAIELFAAKGINGVTFEGLAKQAEVTRGSLYRLFRTTEGLFEQALTTVLSRSLDPANFLLMIFGDKKQQDFPVLVTAAVRKWYYSMSQPEARLLMQAAFSNHQWEDSEGPVEKIIKVLATSIERDLKKNRLSKLSSATIARSLVLGLFQLKVSFRPSGSAKEEKEIVDGMLQLWVRAVSGGP